MYGIMSAVSTLSLVLGMALVAVIAGMLQPEPAIRYIKPLEGMPILLNHLSIGKEILVIKPESSINAIRNATPKT